MVHFGLRLAARLAGEGRRPGYVGGGIGATGCRANARLHATKAFLQGRLESERERERERQKRRLYSLLEAVEDNETDKR